MSNYRDSLTQAQSDRHLSLEQKERLAVNFREIISEARKYLEKLALYIDEIEQLLSIKSC